MMKDKGSALYIALFAIYFTNICFSQENKYPLLLESYNQANYVETYRTFPSQITIQNNVIQPSQYFQLLIKVIKDIEAKNNQSNYSGTWLMPDSLYPSIELSPDIYSRMISRAEYIQLFNSLLTIYPENSKLPMEFTFRNQRFRFIDAYYLALVVSRFYYSYGYLPTIIDPKVATPKGIFPWEAPDDKLQYLSSIQNGEGVDYLRYSEYYENSSMDYEYYKLGKEIIGNVTDQYSAGSLIYDYVNTVYYKTPYGVNYDFENNFGFVYNSYEKLRYMQGTSGTPQGPKYGLYPAIGIPYGYDERGYGSAAYINNHGWINTEYHTAYGSDYLQNPFVRYITTTVPLPTDPNVLSINPGNNVIKGINNILKLSSATSGTRAFWVNPSDVITYGADSLIQSAKHGGFNTIIVTVKSFLGYLYFNYTDLLPQSQRVKEDVLTSLPQLAKANGIKLLVGIHNLSDYVYINQIGCDCGLKFLAGWASGASTNFFVTPCSQDHKAYTKDIIKQLYEKYDIDGIVFMRNYTYYNGWGNSECAANVPADKAAWEKYLADYVNELGSYAKSLDNKMQTYYLTADEINIIGTTYKQSCEEPDPNTIDSNAIDGIILAVNGFTWLFDESNTDFNNIYNKYISSNHPIYITASLSKEWEYPPEFYRGIARYYAGLNSSGIIITANNSGEGELGPAFVKQHYGKLNEIKFTVPPPAQDNITSTEDGKNDTHHIPENISLYQNYPNPFNPITTINYSIPASLYVTLKVYDLLGREVAKLVHEEKPRGVYKVNFDGSKLSSGIYFYRLQAGSFSETKKILLIK